MKMNFILVSLGLLLLVSCNNKPSNQEINNKTINEAGLEILNFEKSELEKIDDISGDFKHAIKWKDKRGENLFIFSIESSFRQWEMEEDGMGDYVNIFNAYHFLVDGKKYLLQKNYLNITPECGSPPFSLESDYIADSFEISDINNNEQAEISFMYYFNCSSEINPKSLALVFIDQNKVYSVSGSEYIKQYYPESGKRFFSPEFKDASKEAIDFVTKKWDKHFKTNPAQTKTEILSKSEFLKNQSDIYEIELYNYINELSKAKKTSGLFYDNDIKKFEYYKNDKKFQQLVDHILEMGYTIKQDEGRYYLISK